MSVANLLLAATFAVCPYNETLCTFSDPNACHVAESVNVTRVPGGVAQCAWSSDVPGQKLIIHSGVKIACHEPGLWISDHQTPACSLAFHFEGGVILRPSASIIAGTVTIVTEGRLVVGSGAHISTDGMGRCGYGDLGDSSSFKWGGAGHGGAGGDCSGTSQGKPGNPFGDASRPWDQEADKADPFKCGCHSYGAGTAESGSYPTSAPGTPIDACCGGGLIVVNASMVQLDGSISADAQKPCIVQLQRPQTPRPPSPTQSLVPSPHAPTHSHPVPRQAAPPPAQDCTHLRQPFLGNATVVTCCDANVYVKPGATGSKDTNYVCQGVGGAAGGSIVLNVDGPIALNGSGAVRARGGNGTAKHTWTKGILYGTSGGGGGRIFMSQVLHRITP